MQCVLSSFTFNAAVTLQVGVLVWSVWRSIPETLHCIALDGESRIWCRVLQRSKAEILVGHKPLSATLSKLALTLIKCPSAVERGWFKSALFSCNPFCCIVSAAPDHCVVSPTSSFSAVVLVDKEPRSCGSCQGPLLALPSSIPTS